MSVLIQVTVRRICYLYHAPYDTVVYVRGGRLAGTLLGNSTEAAVCDVSVRSDEDGIWYGRVSTCTARLSVCWGEGQRGRH